MGSEPQVEEYTLKLNTSTNPSHQDTVVRDIGVRVMNELVMPFKAIQMDDTEFACLKVSKNTCLVFMVLRNYTIKSAGDRVL